MATAYLWLILAVGFEVIATSMLKASDGFTKLWPSLACAVTYAVAFYFLSLCLRTIPVGIAYAIWAGLGIVLIAGIGWAVFGQRLDLAAIIGLALIMTGIVVINVFSGSVSH